MSETSAAFGDSLRSEMLAAQSYHRQRLLSERALQGMGVQASEARRERSEARQPAVYRQILADAREFATVMAEQGVEPTHYLRRPVAQTDLERRMGPMGSDVTELATPVWVVNERHVGGWTAQGYGQFGMYRYTYHALVTGVAIDADGHLWNYSQHQTYSDGTSEAGPGAAPEIVLQPMLEFAGQAGPHQVAPIDLINPHMDDVEGHPAVRQFRMSLVQLAAQQPMLYE